MIQNRLSAKFFTQSYRPYPVYGDFHDKTPYVAGILKAEYLFLKVDTSFPLCKFEKIMSKLPYMGDWAESSPDLAEIKALCQYI